MFRLLRYFSLTNGLAVLVIFVSLFAVHRWHEVNHMVRLVEEQNATLARSFANAVWPRFSSYVASVSGLDGDALRARPETREIHETLRNLTTGLPVLKVKIFNPEGLTVYSSEPGEIGAKKARNPGFVAAARDGIPASKLTYRDTFSAFSGEVLNRDLVESYLPIRPGNGPIEGVFELYSDVTPVLALIKSGTIEVVAGFVAAFGLLYAVLFLIVRRADHTLRRQHDDLGREVAERERAEEELRESEALLRGAVDSLQEGFALYDAEDRLVLINSEYERVNPSAADMLEQGSRYEDVLRANIERGMIAEAIGREEDFVRERLELHRNPGCPILRRFTDGTWYFIRETRTPDGGTAVTFADVTELKRAEEALLQAKQRNDMILEAAGEGIYGLDVEGRTTFINPAAAKMTGWEPEDLIGRPQHDILHHTKPDGTPYPRDDCPIYAALTDGQVHHVRDEVFWRKDGTSFPIEYVSTPIRVEGEIVGAVVVFTDIAERKKAEDALRESEARMRDLVECSSDWIWHTDADLRFSYFSDNFTEVTGIRPEEILGRTRLELGQGDIDDEKWRHHLADLEARRPFRDLSYRFVHRNGRTLHFMVNGKPVFDEAGVFRGYRGVGSDITARVNAEEQAHSAQERLAIAIDGLAEHFVLFDADDRIVLTNAAWRELNRKVIDKAGPGARFEDHLRAAIETGLLPETAGREEEWLRWRMDLHRNPRGPFEVQREDGRWMLVNEQRLPDGGTVLILSDITERKRAEQALRESEERFRAVVDNLVEGVITIDDTGVVQSFNPGAEHIFGYAQDEVVGNSVCLLMPEPECSQHDTYVANYLTTGEAKVIGKGREVEGRCKDGSIFPLELGIGEMVVGRKRIFTGIARDITERKRAEEALREAERRFRNLVDGSVQGILIHQDRRPVYVNQSWAEMHGYTVDEVLAMESVIPLIAPHDRPRMAEYRKLRMEGGEAPSHYEYEGIKKDGSLICLENLAIVVTWKDEPAIQSTIVDITERRRAEKALRESEARFRAVLDNSPTKIHIKDLDGRYTLINRHSEALFGVTDEEARGKTSREIFPKKLADAFAGHDEKVIETGQTIEAEEQWVSDDGLRTYLTVKFPIRDADGEIVAVGAIGTDITEHKRAELVVRESEKRLRTLIDSSSQGILVHRHYRPLYANSTLVEMFGYDTVEDILALDAADALFAPEEISRMRGYHAARLQGKFAPTDHELKGRRKDGSEIWLSNRAFQIEWEDGPAICTTLFDITERKQALEKLREGEERLRLSLAAARVGSFCWNIQENTNLWDDRMHEIWGLEPGTYTSTSTKDFLVNVHPEDAERVSQAIARTLNDDAEHNIEYRIIRPDQSVAYVQELAAVVRDDQKRPVRLIGVCLDITGRKQAEEEKAALELEIQQAGRMEAIGLLAGGIAHEINTPIQYIGDNLRFLDDAWGDIGTVVKKYRKLARAARDKGVLETEVGEAESAADEADLEYLLDEFTKATRQSIEGTDRVADIVLAMKEFSHPSMKEKVAADINQAIKSTLTVSRNEWKHVAEVDLDLDGTLEPVICLAGEVNQVFLNLIINAVHAIAAKGGDGKERITVSTRKDGDWVEIRVADTGTGIPENLRDKIFSPFFTTKEVGKGTGQGLAICHDVVVNKHGGKLFFETEMGKGTTFVVRLPLDAEERASEAA